MYFWKPLIKSFLKVWFADQNVKVLEREDKKNITLVINQSVEYEKDLLFSLIKVLNTCKR